MRFGLRKPGTESRIYLFSKFVTIVVSRGLDPTCVGREESYHILVHFSGGNADGRLQENHCSAYHFEPQAVSRNIVGIFEEKRGPTINKF